MPLLQRKVFKILGLVNALMCPQHSIMPLCLWLTLPAWVFVPTKEVLLIRKRWGVRQTIISMDHTEYSILAYLLLVFLT